LGLSSSYGEYGETVTPSPLSGIGADNTGEKQIRGGNRVETTMTSIQRYQIGGMIAITKV